MHNSLPANVQSLGPMGCPGLSKDACPVGLCSSCKLTTEWYSIHSWFRNANTTFLSNSAFPALPHSSPADHRQTEQPTLCHTDTWPPTLKPRSALPKKPGEAVLFTALLRLPRGACFMLFIHFLWLPFLSLNYPNKE